MKGRENKIIFWLVSISALVIISSWLVWQKHVWKNISFKSNYLESSSKIINNFTEIKAEISKAREQWDQAKNYFEEELSNQIATQTTSTLNVPAVVIDELKKQIESSPTTTSTENIYEEATKN